MKLSEEQRDYIYDLVTFQDPHLKTRDLLAAVDNAVKDRAMPNYLSELGKGKWLQRQRPYLTEEHARKRLE